MNACQPARISRSLMRWMVLAVCCLILGSREPGRAAAQEPLLLPTPPAQSQPAAEVVTRDATPTFSSRVNLVPVSVVVRDGTGHAVGHLTKDDFRLIDNGRPQVITKFSVERADTPVVIQKENPELQAPAAPAHPEPVLATRFFAYLFDDVHLKFEDLAYARDAAARHVATSLQPADRVAVYTTSGRDSLEFTDDRAQLEDALARLRPNPLTGGSAGKCPDFGYYLADLMVNKNDGNALSVGLAMYQACSMNPYITTQETLMQAQNTLSEEEQATQAATRVLQAVVRRLSGMPGQRSIILTSPGFFIEMFGHSDITAIINRAIAAKVIVNTLDARGAWTPPGYNASTPTPMGGSQVINMMNVYLQQEAQLNGEVLGELADGTGGTWIHDNNDIKGAFHRLAYAARIHLCPRLLPGQPQIRRQISQSEGHAARPQRPGFAGPQRLLRPAPRNHARPAGPPGSRGRRLHARCRQGHPGGAPYPVFQAQRRLRPALRHGPRRSEGLAVS